MASITSCRLRNDVQKNDSVNTTTHGRGHEGGQGYCGSSINVRGQIKEFLTNFFFILFFCFSLNAVERWVLSTILEANPPLAAVPQTRNS